MNIINQKILARPEALEQRVFFNEKAYAELDSVAQ